MPFQVNTQKSLAVISKSKKGPFRLAFQETLCGVAKWQTSNFMCPKICVKIAQAPTYFKRKCYVL